MKKPRKISLPIKIFPLIFVILILGVIYSLFEISHNPENAATFADNVLRPVLGNKAVITIEGAIFGIQDSINKIKNSSPSKTNYTSNLNETTVSINRFPLALVPSDIKPFLYASDPLVGEGVWKKVSNDNLYTTFIRTDSGRPYAIVNLVYIPINSVSIGATAGTKHPGGELGKIGPGIVPKDIQESGRLLAAFNGGFQEKDGHYGMYAYGVMYVPMKKGLATVFIYKDGSVSIQRYDTSLMTDNVLVARQNGPMLIENSQVTKSTSKGIDLWAGTSAGGYVTWRSGLGITVNGNLIYAIGPSLTPQSLGEALLLGGSTQAMQLDINNYWVRFMLYSWNPNSNSYSYLPLMKGLKNTGGEFLTGNEKDFFFLYKK